MGRGRLGGTKSKIRGKVGSEIYQLKRDATGDLVQSVYSAPVNPTKTNSPAQAKARCIMGQIERMWHIIPQVIKDAYATIAPGTLSFQHFSKLNYDYVRSRFDLSENAGGSLNWKEKRELAAPAGEWFLCDGTLPEVVFPNWSWEERYNNSIDFYYYPPDYDFSIGYLRQFIGYEHGDILRLYVFVDYADGRLADIHVEDVRLNPELSDYEFIPFQSSYNILIPTTPSEWQFSVGVQRDAVHVQVLCPQDTIRRIIACACWQIIRPTDKGTLFSSCQFRWFITAGSNFYPIRNTLSVWPSWLNE